MMRSEVDRGCAGWDHDGGIHVGFGIAVGGIRGSVGASRCGSWSGPREVIPS
ncbi:hypothetical protein BGW80DRAFT_1348645, partial [Lactifluus volemus]